MTVSLRAVVDSDEDAFSAAHNQLWESDGFALGLNYYPDDEPFADFVQRQADFARGENLPAGLVPATFRVAVVDDVIVGRTSIRHALNEFLAFEGGHIGYAVLPAFRRRGYATAILRQSLTIARDAGVDRALLICDEVNIGSATVIERCGGELVSTAVDSEGNPIRRYEVPTS